MTDNRDDAGAYFIVNDASSNLSIGGTTSSVSWDTSYNVQTPGGFGAGIKLGGSQGKRISPKIYFKFVKSKLNMTEKTNLKKRLEKLPKLIAAAEELDQRALYETLTDELVFIMRENEAAAVGCERFVNRSTITKFMHMVKVEDDDAKIDFKDLEEFPRTVPPNVHRKVALLKKKGVFDNFKVLYLTYAASKEEEIKSNKEKVREKDPIIFGCIDQKPDNMYYVMDWIDEYCDLTFDKFVERINEEEIPGEIQSVPVITEEYINRLKKESQLRRKRLDKTGMSNYKDLMEVEDQVVEDRVPVIVRESLFKRIKAFVSKDLW